MSCPFFSLDYTNTINCLKDQYCLRINILYLVVKQAGCQCRRIKAIVMWSNQDPWFFTDVTWTILASPPTQMLAMFTLANCCQVSITMNSVLNKNESKKGKERLLPIVTTYHPVVQDLKKTLMAKVSWKIRLCWKKFLEDLRSYKRGKSLIDMLVRAKM